MGCSARGSPRYNSKQKVVSAKEHVSCLVAARWMSDITLAILTASILLVMTCSLSEISGDMCTRLLRLAHYTEKDIKIYVYVAV
jgi:hypothetical protein